MSLQPMRRRDREGVNVIDEDGFATQEKKTQNEFLGVKANETNAAEVTENGTGDVPETHEHAEFKSVDMSHNHATCENCHTAPAAWFCHHDGEKPFPRRETFARFSSRAGPSEAPARLFRDPPPLT